MNVPREPVPFVGTQTSPTSITLEWDDPQVPDETTPPVTRYRIQCEGLPTIFVNASVRTYKVETLVQYSMYMFTISAENEVGFSPSASFPPLQPGCHKYGFV